MRGRTRSLATSTATESPGPSSATNFLAHAIARSRGVDPPTRRPMLLDPSRISTTSRRTPAPIPRIPGVAFAGFGARKGRASARATRPIRSIRASISSRSARLIRRRARGPSSRNCIAPHSTTGSRRRLSRWMITGRDTAARPASIARLSTPQLIPRPRLAPRRAGGEVVEQDPLVRLGRRGLVVVGVHAEQPLAQGAAEGLEALEVRRPQGRGIDAEIVRGAFEVAELGGPAEGELLLLGGERRGRRGPRGGDAAGAAGRSPGRRSRSNPSERTITSPRRLIRSARAWRMPLRGVSPPICGLLQRLAEDREMPGRRPGRDHRADPVSNVTRPDRVALADHQVGQRRREPPGVLELRRPSGPA